jgi:hypothetical protein
MVNKIWSEIRWKGIVKHRDKSNQIVEFNLTQLCGEQLSINMNFIYQKVWYMFLLIVFFYSLFIMMMKIREPWLTKLFE